MSGIDYYRCYKVTYSRDWQDYHDEIQKELEAFNELVMFRPHTKGENLYLIFGKPTLWGEEDRIRLKGILERITVSYEVHKVYEGDNFALP